MLKIDANQLTFIRQGQRIAYHPTRGNLGVGLLPKSAVVAEADENGQWRFRVTGDRPLILMFDRAGVLGISDARNANLVDEFSPMPPSACMTK